MDNRIYKYIIGVCISLIIYLCVRHPQPQSFNVPSNVLYSHYRVATKLNGEYIRCGSGIAINRKQILTAAHVVEDGDEWEYDIFDIDGLEVKTVVLHLVVKDTNLDLALLETDCDIPIYNNLDSGDFEVGNWGYIIGCAHATVPYNVYFGVFSSKHGPRKYKDLYQIGALAPSGESGGGVYNATTNKLVGVCVAGRDGFALFVPIKVVKNFIAPYLH